MPLTLDLGSNVQLDEAKVTYYWPEDGPEYEGALRSSWDFIRRMGRYTSRSINAIVAAADRAETRRLDGEPITNAQGPVVIKAEVPFHYDPDTECKHGGVVGVAVLMPDGDNRVLLAVHRDSRRKGVGGALLVKAASSAAGASNPMVTWVAATNASSQMFLLSQGWFPVSLNGAGAVCYSRGSADAVETAEDDVAAIAQELRLRRR